MHMPLYGRYARHNDNGPDCLRGHHRAQLWWSKSFNRFCVHVHRLLRSNVGPLGVGGNFGVVPVEAPVADVEHQHSYKRKLFLPMFVLSRHRLQTHITNFLTQQQWLFNWAIAYSTPYLVNYGPGNANLQSKIFFIWGTACLLCVAFVYFYIFETKGLSLEEVDEMYQTPGLKAKNSSKWRPSIHFRETPLTEVTYNKTTAGSPAEPETAPVAKTTERTEGEAVARTTAPMAGSPPQTDSVPKTLQTAILQRPDDAVAHHHSPLPRPTSLSKLPSPALHSLKSVPSLPTYTDEGTTSSRGPRSIGP